MTSLDDAERKLVTVVFADVAGSTALGESLDPEQLSDVLRGYFRQMRRTIEAHGGVVEKFIGDAVVAIFGVPTAREDDAIRAMRCALQMRVALAAANEDLARGYGVRLEMRTGINRGEVLATTTAAPGEGIVTGDTVNVAARLEQAAEPGQILVSARAARAARMFAYRSVGALELKGRAAAVVAYELLGAPQGEDRGSRPADATAEVGGAGREVPVAAVGGVVGSAVAGEAPVQRLGHAPMIGRGEPLEALLGLVDRVRRTGRPHLVTILGEAGMGKSRLARELEVRIRRASGSSDVTVLRGACLEPGEGAALHAFGQMLLQAVRGPTPGAAPDPAPDTPEALVEAIAAVLTGTPAAGDAPAADGGGERDVNLIGAVLAASLGSAEPSSPVAAMPPRQLRYETQRAWRRFLEALCRRGPLVAVIEDLHWADTDVLDLLEQLTDRIEGPVLFVCLARPAFAERVPGWGAGWPESSTLSLDPLPVDDATRLVTSLLGPDAPRLPFLDRLLSTAEGNPFFLEELVQDLLDQRVVEPSATGWSVAGTMTEGHIPDTVQSVLAARIDTLARPDKRALLAASVIGREFSAEGVARVLADGEHADVGETLDQLGARGFIEPLGEQAREPTGGTAVAPGEWASERAAGTAVAPSERRFRFRHALTREVAYASLPRRLRAGAHLRVAGWLEERPETGRRELAETLAHHHLRAWSDGSVGDPADAPERETQRRRALAALLAAAQEAGSRSAITSSREYAEQALELARTRDERAEALEGQGRALLAELRGDDAWRALIGAIAARLEVPEAEQDRPAIARLAAAALEAPTRWGMHEPPAPDVAREYLRIGLAAAGPDDSEVRVRLLTAAALFPIAFPDARSDAETLDLARTIAEGAAAMAERLDHPDLASAALDGVCLYLYSLGRYAEMQSVVDRRLALVPRLSDPRELQDIHAMAAWCAFHLGDYRGALQHAEAGLAAVADVDPAAGLLALLWRALARFRLGEWSAMLADVKIIDEILGPDQKGRPGLIARHEAVTALVHEWRGERADADERLRSIGIDPASIDATAADEAPDPEDLPLTVDEPLRELPWLARLYSARGGAAAALDALRLPAAAQHHENVGLLLEARCDVVGDGGRWDLAAGVAAAARRLAEKNALAALSIHADRLEGRAAMARGDAARARTLLAGAAAAFQARGVVRDAALCDLDLAAMAAATGDHDESAVLASAALQVMERLGCPEPAARARDLLQQLGVAPPDDAAVRTR